MGEYYRLTTHKSMFFQAVFDRLEYGWKCYEIQQVTDYESVGREFESLQARHKFKGLQFSL